LEKQKEKEAEIEVETDVITAETKKLEAQSELRAEKIKAATGGLGNLNEAKGQVTASDGGKIEAAMLATMAAQAAGRRISDDIVTNRDITNTLNDRGVVIVSTKPSFDQWYSFQAAMKSFDDRFSSLKCETEPKVDDKGEDRGVGQSTFAGAAVVAGVELLAKLARQDLTVTRIDIGSPPIASAVAGRLRAAGVKIFSEDYYPSNPMSFENPAVRILVEASAKANACRAMRLGLERAMLKKPEAKREPDKAEIAKIDSVLRDFDVYALAMGKAGDDGSVPIVRIARQSRYVVSAMESEELAKLRQEIYLTASSIMGIAADILAQERDNPQGSEELARLAAEKKRLENRLLNAENSVPAVNNAGAPYLLWVKEDAAGGNLYTRKTLWTAFGWGKPLQVSAGLVVSYELINPSTGEVPASDTLACPTRFATIAKQQEMIRQPDDYKCFRVPA
jgi:hypothetical protein